LCDSDDDVDEDVDSFMSTILLFWLSISSCFSLVCSSSSSSSSSSIADDVAWAGFMVDADTILPRKNFFLIYQVFIEVDCITYALMITAC